VNTAKNCPDNQQNQQLPKPKQQQPVWKETKMTA
jgi:hypothetical protein